MGYVGVTTMGHAEVVKVVLVDVVTAHIAATVVVGVTSCIICI